MYQHQKISRYVPTQYLQVPTTCCYLSPGTKNTQLLAFSFLVNLTFSASLRSCERMWRQRPSNPDHPARSNILCSCFKISIVQYLEVKYPLFLHQNIQNLPRRWWKQAASRTRTFLQQRSSTRWDRRPEIFCQVKALAAVWLFGTSWLAPS